MSTRLPGIVRARSIRFNRRQANNFRNVGGGGGLPPTFEGGATTFPKAKASAICPRCKTGILDGSSGVSALLCTNCLLEKNLTPKIVFDNLSRYVVGQDNVKQVLAVSMFAHMQRTKANDSFRMRNEKAAAAAALEEEEEDEEEEDDQLRHAKFHSIFRLPLTPAMSSELCHVYRKHPRELEIELRNSSDFMQLPITEQEGLKDRLLLEIASLNSSSSAVADELNNTTSSSSANADELSRPALPQSVLDYEHRIDTLNLNVRNFDKSNILIVGPTGSGKTLMAKTLAEVMKVPIAICDATSLTAAGYVGEDCDSVLYKLMDLTNWDVTRAERGIVYLDEVDKIARRYSGGGKWKDVGGESVQHGMLKILEGTKVTLTKKGNGPGSPSLSVIMDTTNILFMCSGAFDGLDAIVSRRTQARSLGFSNQVAKSFEDSNTNQQMRDALFAKVEPCDLVEYGLIPEFVGRFTALTSTSFLTESDLVRILVEPENSVVNQMKGLFQLSFHQPVELVFTPGALREIARVALERKSGARGLKLILEKLLGETLYDLPDCPHVTHVVVEEGVLMGKGKKILRFNAREYEVWRSMPLPVEVPTAKGGEVAAVEEVDEDEKKKREVM